MTQEELFTKVQNLICENLGCEDAEVTPSARLNEDLGADSLDVVELTMAFEEEFGIEIHDDEVETLIGKATVQSILTFLDSRIAAKKGGRK